MVRLADAGHRGNRLAEIVGKGREIRMEGGAAGDEDNIGGAVRKVGGQSGGDLGNDGAKTPLDSVALGRVTDALGDGEAEA